MESSAINDDVITCRFWREKTTVVQGREFDLVNTPYNLLVAAGKSLKSTYHFCDTTLIYIFVTFSWNVLTNLVSFKFSEMTDNSFSRYFHTTIILSIEKAKERLRERSVEIFR